MLKCLVPTLQLRVMDCAARCFERKGNLGREALAASNGEHSAHPFGICPLVCLGHVLESSYAKQM